MTLAEQLRNEFNIHEVMPWLKEDVIRELRGSGRYCRICDNHVREIERNFSFPFKYYTHIEDWARKEGLNVHIEYNYYGVKHIVITL